MSAPHGRCVSPFQVLVAQKVTMGVYKGVTTSELDELAAETAASLTATHPDYAQVGYVCRCVGRVAGNSWRLLNGMVSRT